MAIGDDQLPLLPADAAPAAPSIAEQRRQHAADNPPPAASASSGDSLPMQTPTILDKTWTQAALRGLGLGTRDIVTGLSSLPVAAADVVTWPGRAIQRAFGVQTTAPSDLVQQGMDVAGLPTPQTPTEQNISTFNRGASAALTPLPGLGPITSAGNLARAGVQGGTGALVGEKAAQSDLVPWYLKPTVNVAAAMLGAKGADVATNLGYKVSNAVAGNMSPVYQAFERQGIPTNLVGTVAGGETGQSAEAALSRVPFASSVLRPAQQQTVNAFGNAVERTATQLDPARNAVTAQTTGEALQAAARDWKDNIFPAQQQAAWQPLNQRLAGASVSLAGYGNALDSVVQRLSLPETQKLLTPALAGKLKDALTKDVPGGSVQWGTAQDLRSAIGQMMGVPEIAQSVGMDALKRAYAGLASDMQKTAAANGQDAVFAAANKVSTDGHAFLEGPLSKVISTNNPAQETIAPEQATRAMLNSGDTTLQAVRARIPGAADQLAAFHLRQAQVAKPSVATTYDDTSTGTFLSNMNRMRQNQPGGYQALYPPSVQQSLEDLSTVAGRLRATERHLNTSGTAESLGWMGYLKGIYDAAAEGGIGKTIGATVIPPAVGLGAGNLMTSQLAARLAAARNAGPAAVPPRVAGLLGSIPQLEAGQ